MDKIDYLCDKFGEEKANQLNELLIEATNILKTKEVQK